MTSLLSHRLLLWPLAIGRARSFSKYRDPVLIKDCYNVYRKLVQLS